MSRKKATPLTVEFFHSDIVPALESMLDSRFERQKAELKKDLRTEITDELSEELETYHNDVIEFKDEVVGEIKTFREEMLVSNHQKERNTKRIERVEKALNLNPIDF